MDLDKSHIYSIAIWWQSRKSTNEMWQLEASGTTHHNPRHHSTRKFKRSPVSITCWSLLLPQIWSRGQPLLLADQGQIQKYASHTFYQHGRHYTQKIILGSATINKTSLQQTHTSDTPIKCSLQQRVSGTRMWFFSHSILILASILSFVFCFVGQFYLVLRHCNESTDAEQMSCKGIAKREGY